MSLARKEDRGSEEERRKAIQKTATLALAFGCLAMVMIVGAAMSFPLANSIFLADLYFCRTLARASIAGVVLYLSVETIIVAFTRKMPALVIAAWHVVMTVLWIALVVFLTRLFFLFYHSSSESIRDEVAREVHDPNKVSRGVWSIGLFFMSVMYSCWLLYSPVVPFRSKLFKAMDRYTRALYDNASHGDGRVRRRVFHGSWLGVGILTLPVLMSVASRNGLALALLLPKLPFLVILSGWGVLGTCGWRRTATAFIWIAFGLLSASVLLTVLQNGWAGLISFEFWDPRLF